MKYLILLLMLSGCSNVEYQKDMIARGKSLCCSQGGLWWIKDDWAHCNNGTNFFDIDEITIIDHSCSIGTNNE